MRRFEVCKAVFWPLLPADGVLWLDWPSGLVREHALLQQLHTALPLLLSERLHHHQKRLWQRLLYGPEARLARLWHGKWHVWGGGAFWVCFWTLGSSWRPAAVGLQGCAASVESWLVTNIGVVLGICVGLAVIEVPQHPPTTHPLHKRSDFPHIRTLNYSICVCAWLTAAGDDPVHLPVQKHPHGGLHQSAQVLAGFYRRRVAAAAVKQPCRKVETFNFSSRPTAAVCPRVK